MLQNRIGVLWIFVLCGLVAGYAVALAEAHEATPVYLLLALFALALAAWTYITVRVVQFKRRMTNFLRRLLAGDYEAGMKAEVRWTDEVTMLSGLANKVGEQLRTYDALRADRVAFSYRALELLHQTTRDRVLLVEVEKETVRLNPAAQTYLDVDRDKVALDALSKQSCNGDFMARFDDAISKKKVPVAIRAKLQVPPSTTCRETDMRILPLKDKAETVKLALVFFDSPEGAQGAPPELSAAPAEGA